MLKKMLSQIKREMVLASRNLFMAIITGMIIIMMVFVNYILPKDFNTDEMSYLADFSEGQGFLKYISQFEEIEENRIFSDKGQILAAVEGDANSIGIIFEGTLDKPEITLIHHGEVTQEQRNIIIASMERLFALRDGDIRYDRIETVFIRTNTHQIPRNLEMVPVLLTFEALILGFFMIAVFVFQEKEEGSIKAYRISPGGIHLYILSKTITFSAISLLYGLVFALLTVGIPARLIDFLFITLLGTLLYTLVGLILGIFFNNLSEWFFAGVAVLTVNMFPLINYAFPAAGSGVLSWLPSYHIIFAYREILFPEGRDITSLYIILIGLNLTAYLISYAFARLKLMGEGS